MSGDETPLLTEHAALHGCSCKVGQDDLGALLADAGVDTPHEELLLGVGEDAAARRLGPELALVQTVDFFTPIVNDPYDFGRVAACNAASDAFATGATEQLSCLVVLAVPRALTDSAPAILSGMGDAFEEMGGVIAGGHTVLNPWPIAGGAVTATAHPETLLMSHTAAPGDRLYLTKPLGTQPAMGALRVTDEEFVEMVGSTVEDATRIGKAALAWMTTPNRAAARVAREHASCATDVTGFGLLGQSRVLAENASVGIELTRLPVIAGTPALSRLFGYGLEDGESAETSGGLLVSVPAKETEPFEAALADADVSHWEVGRVTDGHTAKLVDPEILPVEPDRGP